MKRLLLASVMLGLCHFASAAELPRADPASVGLDGRRLDAITERLKKDVADHVLPGAVLLIARHGKVAYEQAVGSRDPQSGAPMKADDIFRIYSMSKPITVVAALTLLEAGRLQLDDPVSKYLPQFASMQVGIPDAESPDGMRLVPAERPITVQDLMRHSSGLTYGFFGDTPVKKAYQRAHLEADNPNLETFVERLAKLPLNYQPGTTWDYSYSIDVLGRIVEVISGQSLYDYEKAHVLDPLGMTDTGFGVPDAARQDRIAEPFSDDRSFGVNANFSDPRHPVQMQSGGGGMVSTAEDYTRFLQAMLAGGSLDGHRVIGPQTERYMTADQLGSVRPGPYYLPGPGYGFGLGVAVRTQTGVAQFPGDTGDWFWGGAGGTYMWADPARDLAVVWMMQSPRQRLHYRSLLRDLVNAAVMDR
jgi:CubicO group peptidase (beta-lactamase class C family)